MLQAARLLAKKKQKDAADLGRYLVEHLQAGRSLGDSLEAYPSPLPHLFVSMIQVGEETGRLPESLRSLEEYYQLQEQMVAKLRGRVTILLVQLGLAILVIAAVIGITTTLMPGGGVSLFGLRGWGGALGFVGICTGILVALFLFVRFCRRAIQTNGFISRTARKLPGLGPFLEALLLSRFALALRLTMDSSLALPRALKLSFAATADATFIRRGKVAIDGIRNGKDLSVALARTDLLPPMFLEVLTIGEISGVVPERMGQMAQEYHEESVRRAKGLVRWISLGLWGLYAVVVILAIFRVAGMYLNALGI